MNSFIVSKSTLTARRGSLAALHLVIPHKSSWARPVVIQDTIGTCGVHVTAQARLVVSVLPESTAASALEESKALFLLLRDRGSKSQGHWSKIKFYAKYDKEWNGSSLQISKSYHYIVQFFFACLLKLMINVL